LLAGDRILPRRTTAYWLDRQDDLRIVHDRFRIATLQEDTDIDYSRL